MSESFAQVSDCVEWHKACDMRARAIAVTILESILELQVAVSGCLKTAPTGTRDELNGHLYKIPVQYRYLVQIFDCPIYVVR